VNTKCPPSNTTVLLSSLNPYTDSDLSNSHPKNFRISFTISVTTNYTVSSYSKDVWTSA